MERLLGELLSARGREVYTHLFVDRGDLDELDLRSPDADIGFEELAAYAHREHGVALLGVFLGAERTTRAPGELVPVDRTVAWLNPLGSTSDEGLERHGLTRGRVPLSALRGIFGIAETYLPMRGLGRDLVRGEGLARIAERIDGDPERIACDIESRVDFDAAQGPRRVLVVGSNAALSPLIHALARFVPGVTVRVVAAEAPGELVADDAEGNEHSLDRGGRCVYHRCEPGFEAHEAARVHDALADGEGVEAIVFLSNPEADDPDARVGMQVLRFVRRTQRQSKAQLLIELVSRRSGDPLEEQVLRLGAGRFEVTMVSTAQITNYFLVHSAFVPGLMGIYERLLGDRGQEIVHLPLRGQDAGPEVTFADLQAALAPHGALPIAIESRAAGLVIAPDAERRFELGAIEGLFAVTDTETVLHSMRPLPTVAPEG
jgi:hypothetical protein